MASCAYCNSMILFGGVTDGDLRFCNAACHERGHLARVAKRIPRGDVNAVLDEVHQGRCPKCQGKGPIDVHVKHTVWSALYLTSWNSTPMVCCKSCGRNGQFGGLAFCLCLGWWGFPWGLIMTPVQICRNIGGIFGGPNPDEPSSELENIVRLGMAAGDFGPVRSKPHRRRSQVEDDDEQDDFIEDAFESDDSDERPTPRSPSKSSHRNAATSVSSSDKVSCPNCDETFKTSAAVRGRRVKCPSCGGVIEVPE